MDQVVKPNPGPATTDTADVTKCRLIDEYFREQKLSLLEFVVPGVGCYANENMPLAHIKRWGDTNDRMIFPMRLRWFFDEVQEHFMRELVQEITKPVNIRLPMNKSAGFSYKIKTKENVAITRPLVDIKDLEENISLLINEANRFYILYCFPAS